MAEINIEKMAQNVAQRAIQELMDNGVFVSRWIPISERKPEETGEYLVTLTGVLGGIRRKPFVFILAWEHEWLTDEISCMGYSEIEITGWTQLPEPYVPDINVGEIMESEG